MNRCVVFKDIPLPVANTGSENLYYHRQYKLGDISAREVLIKHNLRLVLTIIKNNFSQFNYDVDDLMSIGTIGLIKGIDTYDETKNSSFSGYVSKCIKYELCGFFSLQNKYKEKNISFISLDDVVYEKNGDTLLYRDVLMIDDESLEDITIDREMQKIYCSILYDLLDSLSERDRKIILLYFGFVDGKLYKQREIAEVVNIGRAGVSRVIISTLEKFKKEMMDVEKLGYKKGSSNYSRKLVF